MSITLRQAGMTVHQPDGSDKQFDIVDFQTTAEAMAAIEAKKKAALNEIPEDYSELSKSIDEFRFVKKDAQFTEETTEKYIELNKGKTWGASGNIATATNRCCSDPIKLNNIHKSISVVEGHQFYVYGNNEGIGHTIYQVRAFSVDPLDVRNVSYSYLFIVVRKNDNTDISSADEVLKLEYYYEVEPYATKSEYEALFGEVTRKATAISNIERLQIDPEDGLFNAKDGSIAYTGGAYRHLFIEANYGQGFRVGGVAWNNSSAFPFVAVLDSDRHILSCPYEKTDPGDENVNGFEFVVRDVNAKYIYINGGTRNLPYAETWIEYTSKNANEDSAFWDRQAMDAIIDEQKKNPFAWGAMDKGTIVFTFDDTLNDIDLIEEMSEEYGIPVCFSAIPQNLGNITTATGEGKTVKEVLTIAQEHGNEILCHGAGALTSDSTDEDIYERFVTNKRKLEENGFNVNGIIEIGAGGSEHTFDYARCEKYLRTMYRYSDGYGRNLGLPQYMNGRRYISTDTSANHTLVDSCASNKTLLIFVTHSTRRGYATIDTTESALRDLFSYVKTKDVHLLTLKGAYDMFRSSVLENRIKALMD